MRNRRSLESIVFCCCFFEGTRKHSLGKPSGIQHITVWKTPQSQPTSKQAHMRLAHRTKQKQNSLFYCGLQRQIP
jgi:hypothetical protein